MPRKAKVKAQAKFQSEEPEPEEEPEEYSDAEVMEMEEQLSDDENDEDFQASVPEKKKAPPKKKKAKKNTKKDTKSTKKKKKKKVADDATLFEIVESPGAALNVAAEEWVERYNADTDAALVELINFLIESCGSKDLLSMEDYQSGDVETCIVDLLEEYQSLEITTYPVIGKTKSLKKFRKNFLEFWNRLILKCQNSILYDEELVEPLMAWIIGLSSSTLRAFRHTSTLAGLQLMKSLIGVANTISNDLQGTERLMAAEKKKNKKSNKLKGLASRLESLRQRMLDLEAFMEKLFNGIFVLRYRDTNPDIRATCIKSLGEWIKDCPSSFLGDEYLKYLGWMLYDKSPDVRRGALQSLERLFHVQDFVGQLGMFTERFKPRMVDMTKDADTNVAAAAISLITLLLGYDFLKQGDIQIMYSRISVENPVVSKAAAAFVHAHLFEQIIADQIEEQDLDNRNEACMRGLVQFIVEYSHQPEYPNFIVDALWDHTDIMQDWDTMTNLLLFEDEEAALKDEELSMLVDILYAAGLRAMGESITGFKVVEKSSKKKEREATMMEYTKCVASALPALLTKFQADGPKIIVLAKLPQLFVYEVIEKQRLQKSFNKTLDKLEELVFLHNEKAVHMSLAASLAHVAEHGSASASTKAKEKCLILLDEMVTRLKAAELVPSKSKKKKQPPASEAKYGVLVALRRLSSFSMCCNTGEMDDLYAELDFILQQIEKDDDETNVEICTEAMTTITTFILWAAYLVDVDEPNQGQMLELVTKRDVILVHMVELLDCSNPEIDCAAAQAVLQIVGMFAPTLAGSNITLMAYQLERATQEKIFAVIESRLISFADLYDDEDVEEEVLATEKERVRSLLVEFGKAIAFGWFDLDLGGALLAHYVDYSSEFAEPIKTMLKKVRERCINDEWQVVLDALKRQYEGFLGSEQDDTDFGLVVELARKLNLLYGINVTQYRMSLQSLLSEGIQVSFQNAPQNLRLLDALSCFVSHKLPRADRENTLKYYVALAQEQLEVEDTEEWRPFHDFQEMLEESLVDHPDGTAKKKKTKTTATRRKLGLSSEPLSEPVGEDASLDEDTFLESQSQNDSIGGASTASKSFKRSASRASRKKSLDSSQASDGWMSKSNLSTARKGRRGRASSSMQSPALSAGSIGKKKKKKAKATPVAGKRKRDTQDSDPTQEPSLGTPPPSRRKRARV